MREKDWKGWLQGLGKLSPRQRQALLEQLRIPDEGQTVLTQLEDAELDKRCCPHCSHEHVVKNGQSDGLQRYKCRGCSKTFNALTGTPLARLRQRHKWHAQTRALDEGLSIHRAAERLQVGRSTAFRWRHRFLSAMDQLRPAKLCGIAEADETFVLRSNKGQSVSERPARHRGGCSRTRGTSDDHVPIVVARDRAGRCTDFILGRCSKSELTAALAPVLADDAVLCTDGSAAMAAAAIQIGIEHHALNMTSGPRVQGPWHIQNVNAYHARLKDWMRRFRGVATSRLHHYLAWFRTIDRAASQPIDPASLLDCSLGRAVYH